jgi:hypothetical protein
VRRGRDEGGFASGLGLVAMALGLLLVAILVLISFQTFGGTAGGHDPTSNDSSILSHSSEESQLKLCVEGRDSSYGNPPSPAQQGKCASQLAGQVSGDNP